MSRFKATIKIIINIEINAICGFRSVNRTGYCLGDVCNALDCGSLPGSMSLD